MSFTFVLIGSYSIAIAALTGLIRLRKIHRSYQPFVFITIISLLNEIISSILIHYHKSNAINTNVLGIMEGILWMWQFKNWRAFEKYQKHFSISVLLLITVWILEKIIFGKLFTFSPAYAIFFPSLLVFLSINQVNRQIAEEKGVLLKNATFLICSGNIIFNTYRIIVECFYVLEIQQSSRFLANIFGIMVIANVFVNLLFALATLWIPNRQKFSLPYFLLPAFLLSLSFISL